MSDEQTTELLAILNGMARDLERGAKALERIAGALEGEGPSIQVELADIHAPAVRSIEIATEHLRRGQQTSRPPFDRFARMVRNHFPSGRLAIETEVILAMVRDVSEMSHMDGVLHALERLQAGATIPELIAEAREARNALHVRVESYPRIPGEG